jgi:hypothetical protein
MQVVRGGPKPPAAVPEGDDDALGGAHLALSEEAAGRLAEELVEALAATYPARLARARADGQWMFHLGDVIDEARTDFHRAIGDALPIGDQLFDAALERLRRGEVVSGASMIPGSMVDRVGHGDTPPGTESLDDTPRGA